MIKYIRADQVDDDVIYAAFKEGFSDYIMKMDMPKATFILTYVRILPPLQVVR